MDSPFARFAAWVDLLFVDLGLLRLPFNRPVEVAPGIWRSNQPTPWRLKRLANEGFRTVLNLRGEGLSGSFYLEAYSCQRLGMHLESIRLSSRRPPPVDRFKRVVQVLTEAPGPILLHCKSGADRAGLVAAVAVLLATGDVDRARQQLSLKYFHIQQASTGMMDHVLECYASAQAESGISLSEWVERQYDPVAISASYKGGGWLSFLVDWVLRRE